MVIKLQNNSEIIIIAHRGGKYWKGKGKNFNYISESLHHGADVIELDVRVKENKYIVQHSKAALSQGFLEDALEKIGTVPLYLDIKDPLIDPNDLIKLVRKKLKNQLIIGSFYSAVLKKIKKKKGIIISYQVYSPLYDLKLVKRLKVDWVVLWNYNIAGWKIKELQTSGLKFAPAGNLMPRQQMRYVKRGANAVFVYDIKKFKKNLLKRITTQEKQQKSVLSLLFSQASNIYRSLNTVRKFIPNDKLLSQSSPKTNFGNYPHLIANLSTVKINFKLK
ncbi:MAG: hypothetical protein AABX03_01275 [Nanoarchaeota archaeon]